MVEFYVFFAVCILIVLCSFLYNFYKEKRGKASQSLHPLIAYGKKIEVDLEQCELKTNSYYEEIENTSFPTRLEMIDSIYPSKQKEYSVKKEVSVLLYKEAKNDGTTVVYRSDPIYLQADMIRYYMLQHKTTTVYVDPSNSTRYFFDTSFVGKF